MKKWWLIKCMLINGIDINTARTTIVKLQKIDSNWTNNANVVNKNKIKIEIEPFHLSHTT